MVSYDEIRDYVLEISGKRVSNKWIAEVKRKVGMLQFNIDGEERELTCPQKAEELIIKAFEHFDIINDRNDLSKLNDEFNKSYMEIPEEK